MMAHHICFMPTTQIILPPVQAKFHLFVHVVPHNVSVLAVISSPICQLLFLLELLHQLMQLLHCFLHPLFFSLPLCSPPIALLPLHIYFQSFLLHKWFSYEIVALLYLCTLDNISLTFVAPQ